MSRFARTALDRIAGYLPRLRVGHTPLSPRILLASRGESTDDEIAFFAQDGRRHAVHVQVGEACLCANASFFSVEDLGDGMSVHAFESLRQGPMRRSAAGPFVRDLAAAFAEQPEAFEPHRAPGVGSHPHVAAMVSAAREAAEGTGLVPALNHDGAGAVPEGDDEVAFLDGSGIPSPVRARTRPGGFATFDAEAGTLGPNLRGNQREALVEALREALSPVRAPGP